MRTLANDKPCSNTSVVPSPLRMISYDWINPFGDVGGVQSTRKVVALRAVTVDGARSSGTAKIEGKNHNIHAHTKHNVYSV